MTLPVTPPTPVERAYAVQAYFDELVARNPEMPLAVVNQHVRERVAREIREHAELEVRALAQRVMEGSTS